MKKVRAIYTRLQNPLVKGSLVYTVAGLINSLIPFLLLPILTNYLNPEQYGILSTFMVIVSIFILLIGIDQHGFVSVNYFKKSKEELAKYIFTTILISVIFLGVFICITSFFPAYFESLIKIKSEWIILALIIAFFQFVSQLNLTMWQLKELPVYYGLFQIIYSIINYGFSLFFIISFGMGEEGRIYGIAIAAISFGLISIFILIKNSHFVPNYNIKVVIQSLRFCLPLVPHGLAGWINSGLDKVMINNFVSVSENGIYSISYQFGMIIGLIGSSFNRAFVPILYKKLNENNPTNKYTLVKYTYFYFSVLTLITFAMYFATPLILKLFISSQYESANKYIFWIMIGFLADGFYYGVVNYLFYEKKTHYLSIVTFLVAFLHVMFSYIFIPILGPIAASYATALGYIVSFVLVWYISNKIHPMPWLYPAKIVLNRLKTH